MDNVTLFIIAVSLWFIGGCLTIESDSVDTPFDTYIDLDFTNTITDDSLNVYHYHYLYNGGGVGLADFNSDGHLDIYLSGNQVSGALLINDGAGEFINQTTDAGLSTDVWTNGVSIVDINHDGRMDIYLSVGGPNCDMTKCRNLLFINESTDDDLKFAERATEFGLDHTGYSQQGLFLDVDLDGDLDLYQLQNYVDPTTKNYPKPKRYFSAKSLDRLYLNQEVESGVIEFVDQSDTWNIAAPGFGLGLVSSDFNQDGYPDIYIANDFISDDLLYLNHQGEYFIESSAELLRITSYNSMGVDVRDINQDQHDDIMVVDMLPYTNARQKTMLGAMNFDKYQLSLREGYNPQIIRNTLQLSNGIDQAGQLLSYSEVGAFLDLHETDWSWSPLMADFDNDSDLDLYITNGYGKNITDLDFVNYNSNISSFGNQETFERKIIDQINQLQSVPLPNHYFQQEADGGFVQLPSTQATISNGASYGDIDNDGDLDLVVNHINQKAQVLINDSSGNYLKIKLKQGRQNIMALGAKVKVILSDDSVISQYYNPLRGYLSTMSPLIHFGLGSQSVKRIEVVWPDRTLSIVDTLVSNTTMLIDKEVHKNSSISNIEKSEPLLVHSGKVKSDKVGEDQGHEFNIQPLMLISDKIPEYFVSDNSESNLVIDRNGMSYELGPNNALQGIGDLDIGPANVVDFGIDHMSRKDLRELALLIQTPENLLKVNVYTQQNNTWTLSGSIPLKKANGTIELLDLDGDSLNEIVVGYSADADQYPIISDSSVDLLKWDGNELIFLKDAQFSSITGNIDDIAYSQDGKTLGLIGEWNSPILFANNGTEWDQCENSLLDSLSGLWQHIEFGDLDNDGDQDLILMNIGSNNRYRAPLYIVNSDLDNNGMIDPILSQLMSDNKLYTYHTKDDLAKQLPFLKQAFASYESFGSADLESVLGTFNKSYDIAQMNVRESLLLENIGNCTYRIKELPQQCQWSILNDCHLTDLNGDGLEDVVFSSNASQVEVHNGPLTSLNGLVLLNKGDLRFEAISVEESGLNIPGESYDIIDIGNNQIGVSTESGLEFFELNEKGSAGS